MMEGMPTHRERETALAFSLSLPLSLHHDLQVFRIPSGPANETVECRRIPSRIQKAKTGVTLEPLLEAFGLVAKSQQQSA